MQEKEEEADGCSFFLTRSHKSTWSKFSKAIGWRRFPITNGFDRSPPPNLFPYHMAYPKPSFQQAHLLATPARELGELPHMSTFPSVCPSLIPQSHPQLFSRPTMASPHSLPQTRRLTKQILVEYHITPSFEALPLLTVSLHSLVSRHRNKTWNSQWLHLCKPK